MTRTAIQSLRVFKIITKRQDTHFHQCAIASLLHNSLSAHRLHFLSGFSITKYNHFSSWQGTWQVQLCRHTGLFLPPLPLKNDPKQREVCPFGGRRSGDGAEGLLLCLLQAAGWLHQRWMFRGYGNNLPRTASTAQTWHRQTTRQAASTETT